MSLTLHAVTIPSFQQILNSVVGLLNKAETHCLEHGIAQDDIIQARLAPDMLPFAYQVKSTVVHSIGAIEGVRKGVFAPDMSPPGATFAALFDRVNAALGGLAALDPDEINSFVGRAMRFEIRGYHADFTAEQFLLSFSLPNFYFHATTAYDILRMKGLAIGKVDYRGSLDLKK